MTVVGGSAKRFEEPQTDALKTRPAIALRLNVVAFGHVPLFLCHVTGMLCGNKGTSYLNGVCLPTLKCDSSPKGW